MADSFRKYQTYQEFTERMSKLAARGYEKTGIGGSFDFTVYVTCSVCGAILKEEAIDLHERWHANVALVNKTPSSL